MRATVVPDRTEIEAQIRRLLLTETSAVLLSNKLFSPPHGLYCVLGGTEAERKAVAQTPLFQEALERLAVLRDLEVAVFVRAARDFQAPAPGSEWTTQEILDREG
jgi:hypothetical protein